MESPSIKIEHIDVGKLTPFFRNAKRHDQKQIKGIAESIKRFGFTRPFTVDKNNVLAIGHGMLEAVKLLGFKTVPCIRKDELTDEEIRALRLIDNRLSEMGGGWDQNILGEEFATLSFDMEPFNVDFDGKFMLPEVIGATDPDAVPEPPKNPITKRGDLWILGDHRLLCGDSTQVTDVERLMAGEKAEMCFTDPPYGVGYTGGHFHSGDVNIKRDREKLANDADDQIYSDVVPVISSYVDGPCYTWFSNNKPTKLLNAVEAVGEISAVLIWHKINAKYAAMGAQYKNRHEPMLYWKPKGSTLRWVGASTESTLWEVKRDASNNFHPTQKPVELAERAISNHDAKTVLDLFGGSGSTLIACEKTKRKCFMMELSEAYCDVIISRWQDFTGEKAKLENS